jgi:hypothetical protein
MRSLVVGLILALASLAHARCGGVDVMYWPPDGAQISAEPILLISGSASKHSMIRGLKAARLVSRTHTVKLRKVVQHTGAVRVMQAAWAPVEPLRPGLSYALELTGRTRTWRPKRYTPDWKKRVRVRWSVAKTVEPPASWAGSPRMGESNYTAYGCGPAVSQKIAVPLTVSSAMIEATVRYGETQQTYVLPVSADGLIDLGRNMCWGAFSIEKAGQYTAQLAILRPDGTRVPAPAVVSFTGVSPITTSGR